jgi:RNA-directed DNA polymerase
VRQVAKKDKKVQFTALLHHVTYGLLLISYLNLKKKAAAGVDGVTWAEYGENLEERLVDLQRRIPDAEASDKAVLIRR